MGETRKRPPARTPEEEENYMIGIAVKAAEDQILSGKASSQLLTHYLKLATAKERLEKQKLEAEVELIKAKKEYMDSQKQLDALYTEAMKAFAAYSGNDVEDDDEYEAYDL